MLVAGGRGGIGGRLARLLADRGDHVFATVRSADQVDEVGGDGVEAVVVDVTADVPAQLADAGVERVDAVVYAIGAGAGSGIRRKATIDMAGSDKLVAWAEGGGAPRFLEVSSHGAHDPGIADGEFVAYLLAKRAADLRLVSSGLDWVVVRPGTLHDDAASGVATPAADEGGGRTSRDAVAAFLLACLDRDDLARVVTELTDGDTSVEAAVAAL